jgi:hypothetical protein
MSSSHFLAICLLATVPATSRYPAEPALPTTTLETPVTAAALLGGTTPLQITCPDEYKGMCDANIADPSVTGTPTAVGGCGGPLVFSHTDVFQRHPQADRFQFDILRTWTVTDPCGASTSCTQVIHIMRQLWALDIKPTSCPNPINIGGGGGQVSIAILGWNNQDVSQIDPTSIQIWRENGASGPLAPNMVTYEDVATPFINGNCGCTTLGADGFMDLRLRFDKQELISVLNLANVPPMTYTRLVVTARLFSGCELVASDCVRVQ